MKSTNGGISWVESDSGIHLDSDTRVTALAIQPTNTEILYAGTGGFFGGKFYKSTDGGSSWQDATTNTYLQESINIICMDPSNPNIMYIGTGGTGTFLKSTDGGSSWGTTGYPVVGKLITDILVHPNRTNEVYVSTSDTAYYRSTDAGVSWNAYDEGLPYTEPPAPALPDTIVGGIKIEIDPSEDILFGMVGQAKTGPPLRRWARSGNIHPVLI